MAGKGDTYRPVKKKVFDTNFDEIKWKSQEGVNSSSTEPSPKASK